MAILPINISFKGDFRSWLDGTTKKLESSTHKRHVMKNIVGRIAHAAITYNFKVEARSRPKKWPALKFSYAKIKESMLARGTMEKTSVSHPEKLGIYPTPWGQINVATGYLFNTLGRLLRVTDDSLVYGSLAPYASQVHSGHKFPKGYKIPITYDRKTKSGNWITVSYTKQLKKSITVPPRPFDFISGPEREAIAVASMEYFLTPGWRKTVIIPKIVPDIKAPGGRRVYILGKG